MKRIALIHENLAPSSLLSLRSLDCVQTKWNDALPQIHWKAGLIWCLKLDVTFLERRKRRCFSQVAQLLDADYIGNWVTMFVCLISFLINLWNGGNCVKLCGRTAVWFWGQSDSRSKYWLEEDDSVTFVLCYNMSGTRNRNKTVQWKQKYSFQFLTSAHWTKCTMEDEGSRNTQARGS
jgi:hypothetical protein